MSELEPQPQNAREASEAIKSAEEVERLRKVNLYDAMEDTYKFQTEAEFRPLEDDLLGVPEQERITVEERFDALVEQYGAVFEQVGLKMEYVPKATTQDSEFTLEEDKDYFTPRVDIHISNPQKFTTYLKVLDGKSISPEQAVAIDETFERLLQHLGTKDESVYSVKNPSEEMYNFLKSLPTIHQEFTRMHGEIHENKAAEQEGYFYFGEEAEEEGAAPPWHLGEDFKWENLQKSGAKAGELVGAIKEKKLREYLLGNDTNDRE